VRRVTVAAACLAGCKVMYTGNEERPARVGG
jgi:hypothetical protein